MNPTAQVLEDLADHVDLLDEGDHAHRTRAPGANQGVDRIYLLDQTRPVAPERLVGQFRLQDAGYEIILVGFLVLSPRHVAVIPVVADRLFNFVRYVGKI